MTDVTHGSRRFVFTRPLEVRVVEREGVIWHECDPLAVWACGADEAEAERDFAEEIAGLHDHYGLADDEDLSADAAALKRAIVELVERVEEV